MSLGGQQLEGRPARLLVEALDRSPRSRLDLGLRPQHSPTGVNVVSLLRPPAPPPSPSTMPPTKHRAAFEASRSAEEVDEQELSPRERGRSITRLGGVILVGSGAPRKKSPRGSQVVNDAKQACVGGSSDEAKQQTKPTGVKDRDFVPGVLQSGVSCDGESDSDKTGNLTGVEKDFDSKIKAWDARKRERIRRAGRHDASRSAIGSI